MIEESVVQHCHTVIRSCNKATSALDALLLQCWCLLMENESLNYIRQVLRGVFLTISGAMQGRVCQKLPACPEC